MKRILCAIAVSAVLSASANAETVKLVVKSDEIQSVADQPWMISYKSLYDGYVRVTVDEQYESLAKDELAAIGSVYDDAPIRSIKALVNDSDRVADAYSQSLTFNDPLYSSQYELSSGYNEIMTGKESLRDINARPVIAVLDTGARAHEDLVFAGGYSVTTVYEQELSEDYTDLTTDDDGATCYSGHGNQMAGIIAATSNNSKGIVGIADVDLYMGRVMSTNCSTGVDTGTISDLYVGFLWASGVLSESEIPTPDVVSVSLTAESVCPTFLQESIDDLVAGGTTVVVSAGNYTDSVAKYTPANCANVIVVGSHDVNGDMATYSNNGDQVDISVDGRRMTTNGDNDYELVNGTSSATAAAVGMIAVIKSNFPDATPEEIEYVIKNSATAFPDDSTCTTECGEGMFNLNDALRLAEKVIDPEITFSHAFLETDDCQSTREVEALMTNIDACNATKATITTHYQEEGVEYNYRLYRKDAGVVGWESDSSTLISSVTADSDNVIMPILDTDFTEYEYAVVACDSEGNVNDSSLEDTALCPFFEEMAESDITYPDSCD